MSRPLALAVLGVAVFAAVAGAVFSPARTISVAGEDAEFPDVGVAADGRAYVAWMQGAEGDRRVVGRWFAADGSLGPTKRLSGMGYEGLPPKVAVAPTGEAIVSWNAIPTSGSRRIEARQVSASGDLGPRRVLVQDSSVQGQRVSINSAGDALVAWDHGNDVEARRFSATGVLGPVHVLSQGDGDASGPEVVLAPDGEALAVWGRFVSGRSRVEMRSISALDTLGPIQLVAANSGRGKVAQNASGDAVVVWGLNVGNQGDDRIQFRRVLDDGSLGPVATVSTRGGDHPQVGVADDRDVVVAWQFLNGPFRVQVRQISADGTLGPASRLSKRAALRPDLAVEPDGDATVVWLRLGSSQDVIEARRVLADGTLEPVQTLAGPMAFNQVPQVSTNAAGSAVAAWDAYDGENVRVQISRGP